MANENYEKIVELCKKILEDIRQECNLEEDFKKRLYELTLEWERRKEKVFRENKEIGDLRVIFIGLLKTINQAEGLAKYYNKDVCYYLEMSLRNKWLENYCFSMWN
jgi:hypothetical protein